MFDDVELTAEEIARLARQARPLVQSRGRWVELDRADLAAAAAALAERADKTQLTGAEMLRHALGLEGSPLAGGVASRAGAGPPTCSAAPPSSRPTSTLRPRASSASCAATRPRRWRGCGFLDGAGLGGCLALDMGLGKTPTMLAHLVAGDGSRAPAPRW